MGYCVRIKAAAQSRGARPRPVKDPLRRYAPLTDSPQTYTSTYGEDARGEEGDEEDRGRPELCSYYKSRRPPTAGRA